MSNPSVTFHVPHDYPQILIDMFSADILAQIPDNTMAEIVTFTAKVQEIKDDLAIIGTQLPLFPALQPTKVTNND